MDLGLFSKQSQGYLHNKTKYFITRVVFVHSSHIIGQNSVRGNVENGSVTRVGVTRLAQSAADWTLIQFNQVAWR